jgi:hypothetical protein
MFEGGKRASKERRVLKGTPELLELRVRRGRKAMRVRPVRKAPLVQLEQWARPVRKGPKAMRVPLGHPVQPVPPALLSQPGRPGGMARRDC